MNYKFNNKQFLSALKNVSNEHPSIIKLSNLSLSCSNLRFVLEQLRPSECNESAAAFELYNTKNTGLTKFACKRLAVHGMDGLNHPINELSDILGHFLVWNKLCFSNLSRKKAYEQS